MPYIEQGDRDFLDKSLKHMKNLGLNPGDLAYIFTDLLLDFTGGRRSYKKYATAIGILETVKMEIYRREIVPYEKEKCEQNGDVFES